MASWLRPCSRCGVPVRFENQRAIPDDVQCDECKNVLAREERPRRRRG